MTLQDAVKSGKPFRHKEWSDWDTKESLEKTIQDDRGTDITVNQLISDDCICEVCQGFA